MTVLLFCSNSRSLPVKLKRAAFGRHAPIRIHQQRDHQQWDSTNWSGYAVTGAKDSVTSVAASWIVPAVNCSPAPTGYSSFWVGIDGFSSNTVEQIGTDSDCVSLNGAKTDTPTYYAWFEFYPQNSYLIEFPRAVEPGDYISAEVTADSGSGAGKSKFTVTLTDLTRVETFNISASVAGAHQSSAEWIAEAPCCTNKGGVLPLSDFGIADYGYNFTGVSNTGSATVGKATGPIGSFGSSVQSITMVGESAPSTIKAQPSSLSTNETSFSVTWLNAGP